MADIDDTLDFKSLEKELSHAIARDEKYQRENDAKFRAIHQKVQSYEEFRDIVEASHLKPLDKEDKLGGMSYQKWNAMSSNKAGEPETVMSQINKEPIKQPQTSGEFLRTWKRQCSTMEAKYSFLLSIDHPVLCKCFVVECPLGEIISCLNSNAKKSNADKILPVLDVMRKAKRFRLLLDFLSTTEQKQLKDIFENLKCQINLTDSSQLEQFKVLCAEYKVKTCDL